MKARREQQAFTLVEVLAAMAFLGLLMPVILSALLTSNRAGVVAERAALAGQLAENELSELMLGGAWSSSPRQGDFAPDYPDYSWELSDREWPDGAMTELDLTVRFQVQGHEHHVTLSTLVSSIAATTVDTP